MCHFMIDIETIFFRLTPVYAFLIFFSATWLTRMGDGPFWKNYTEIEYTFCRRNWWINLLYINNYITAQTQCMLHAWFLAADFQLSVMAVILFAIILKYPRSVVYLFSGIVVGSIILVGIISYKKDLMVGLMMSPEFLKHITAETNEFVYMHIPTHTNVGCFVVGLVYGYLYHRLQKAGIDLKKNKVHA